MLQDILYRRLEKILKAQGKHNTDPVIISLLADQVFTTIIKRELELTAAARFALVADTHEKGTPIDRT